MNFLFLGRGRKNVWWYFKSLFFSFDSFADKSPTVQTDKHKNIFIKRAISESRVKSPLRNQRYRTDDASTVNSDWRWMKGSFSAFDFVWTSTWYYHVSKRAERDFLTCAVISTPSDDKHSSQCWWWQGSQKVTSCQCSYLTYSCGCDCDPAFQSRTKRFFTIWHKSSPHSPASIRGERAAETLFSPSLCVCMCVSFAENTLKRQLFPSVQYFPPQSTVASRHRGSSRLALSLCSPLHSPPTADTHKQIKPHTFMHTHSLTSLGIIKYLKKVQSITENSCLLTLMEAPTQYSLFYWKG